MKFHNLTRMALLIAALAVSVVFVGAQDTVEEATPDNFLTTFNQAVDSGSFELNEDDTYTLTVNGVGENLFWTVVSPSISAGITETNYFATQWGSSELGLDAVMTVDDVVIEMTLSTPEFDFIDGALIFNADVTDLYFTSEDVATKDGAVLPESFDAASLTILADAETMVAINEAEATMRGSSNQSNRCPHNPVKC